MEEAVLTPTCQPTTRPTNNTQIIICGSKWTKCLNFQWTTSIKTGCSSSISSKSRWVRRLTMQSLNRYFQRVTMEEACDWKTQTTRLRLSRWSSTITTQAPIVWLSRSFNSSRATPSSAALWTLWRVSNTSKIHQPRYLKRYSSSSSSRACSPRCRVNRRSTSPRQARCSIQPARASFLCSNLYCNRKRGARRGSVDKALLVSSHPSVSRLSRNSNYIKPLRLLKRAWGS